MCDTFKFVLHVSLIELAEQAPRCEDIPTFRGVLAEAADLARNAAVHASDATDIASWYSSLLRGAFASPAVASCIGDAELFLTGPAGRNDALPGSPLTWLTVMPNESSVPNMRPFLEVLHSVGVVLVYPPWPAFTRKQWEARIAEAGVHADGAALGWLYDAGSWFSNAVVAQANGVQEALWQEVLRHRPPSVRVSGGLPDRDIEIDLARNLLHPVTRITRWAGVVSGYSGTYTRQRLEHARQAGVLSLEETTLLAEAWRAGHALRLQRWLMGLGRHTEFLADMPPLQRSTFGASCRAVSDVTRAVAARHGFELGSA